MAQIKYVVHGGCVGCSMGSATTTLVGTTNSRIGSQIRMLEPNTGSDSFVGNFGICKILTAQNKGIPTPCAMSNILEWINTNDNFISGSDYPVLQWTRLPFVKWSQVSLCRLMMGKSLKILPKKLKNC